MIALTKPQHNRCEGCKRLSLVDMIVEFQASNIINGEQTKTDSLSKKTSEKILCLNVKKNFITKIFTETCKLCKAQQMLPRCENAQ